MLKQIQGPAKLPDPGCLLKPSFYHCIAVTSSGNSSAHRPSSADGGSGFYPSPHSTVNAERWNRCKNQSLKPALADSAGTSSTA